MLFSLPFRGAFQISLTVLVCYRSPVRYLALDRHHDPNSASTLKLTYSQARKHLASSQSQSPLVTVVVPRDPREHGQPSVG